VNKLNDKLSSTSWLQRRSKQELTSSWDGRPFGHNRHRPKKGGWCAPFRGDRAAPHLTQCGLGRDLPPYQVASWSIQPFGHNRHGPKIEGAVPLWGGQLGPHLTQCRLGRRLPPLPNGIFIRPAVWPQQTWGENWGCLFWGGVAGCPFKHNVAGAEAYLRAKFHLDPSNRFGHNTQMSQTGQTHRERQTDRQRSDSIGRTVLQTVAQ